jgi:hypothetical protein
MDIGSSSASDGTACRSGEKCEFAAPTQDSTKATVARKERVRNIQQVASAKSLSTDDMAIVSAPI